jgi:hypothetical protein
LSPCTFRLRKRAAKDFTRQNLDVEPRSAYMLRGPSRTEWEHGIAGGNPHTSILGHMTGRQLLRRPGYDIDIEKVLRACARHDVAVEINAHPWRLDLDWRWHRFALDCGCMLSINPDAALHQRARSYALGGRDGAQRRRTREPRS